VLALSELVTELASQVNSLNLGCVKPKINKIDGDRSFTKALSDMTLKTEV
jgi:hypothetical protein